MCSGALPRCSLSAMQHKRPACARQASRSWAPESQRVAIQYEQGRVNKVENRAVGYCGIDWRYQKARQHLLVRESSSTDDTRGLEEVVFFNTIPLGRVAGPSPGEIERRQG